MVIKDSPAHISPKTFLKHLSLFPEYCPGGVVRTIRMGTNYHPALSETFTKVSSTETL